MAFVFKRSGSPYWYAGYSGPDGRQIKRSTGCRIDLSTKKAAELFAQKMEESSYRARQGAFTAARARLAVSDIADRAGGESINFQTSQQWLGTWLAGKASVTTPGTYLAYKKAVNDFLAFLGPVRAGQNIEQLGVRDFQSFRDFQVDQGKTPQRANYLLTILRFAFTLAKRQGLIQANPADAVQRLKAAPGARKPFTAEQIADLVNAATGDWQGVVLTGFYTGQRLRDITNLQRKAIDLTAGSVAMIQGKTKRQVAMPLHPVLKTWLARHLESVKGPDVFPSLAGIRSGGEKGLSESFKKLMKEAGIVSDRARSKNAVKGSKGRDLMALSFHSLRHTFNSILANAGIAQEIRQELTGHASAATNRIYTHHEIAIFAGALNALPTLGITEI